MYDPKEKKIYRYDLAKTSNYYQQRVEDCNRQNEKLKQKNKI